LSGAEAASRSFGTVFFCAVLVLSCHPEPQRHSFHVVILSLRQRAKDLNVQPVAGGPQLRSFDICAAVPMSQDDDV
jgi:hypothetical protein